MWLIFIVVVLVLAILMVFLIMAIRILTSQAGQQLNRYFLKNLETYDRLAENRNREIGELTALSENLMAQIEKAQLRLKSMSEATSQISGTVSAISAGSASDMSGAQYCDPDFLENYAYVRQNMKFDYHRILKDLLASFDYREDEMAKLCKSMLLKLPQESLYDLVIMPDEEQQNRIRGMFSEKERLCLDAYIEKQGSFDVLEFRNDLSNFVESESNDVYIRTSNPDEIRDMDGGNVHVLFDPGVHEGFRVSFKNTVYDYSL